MADQRTGDGIRKGAKLAPAEVAARLERMRKGWKSKAQKDAELRQLAVDVAGMTLDQLRKRIDARYLTVALYRLGGMNDVEIARAIGFASKNVVQRIIRRPDVQRIIDLVKAEQVERAINGEFGVQAAAKAAAPKVTKRIIEFAGGIEDEQGAPKGIAARPSDAIRAGETVLRLSGDLVERKEHVHLAWIDAMDPSERQQFIESGGTQWPERFRHIGQTLRDAAAKAPPAIDVTPERP